MNKTPTELAKGSVGGALAYCILIFPTDWFHLLVKPDVEVFWTTVAALGVGLTAVIHLFTKPKEDKNDTPAN